MVSVEYMVFTCVIVYIMIYTKIAVIVGRKLSEHASRYQTSVESLEVQNIIEAPF